ncbi:MAG: hypothetical protein AABX60_00960 [Nanoarchaeota archaeon]
MPARGLQLRMQLEDTVRRQTAQMPKRALVTALQISDKYQHIDGDQFYVAIERVRHPGLAGKPVVIRYKSIVSATSYEARALGIKAGMPYAQAVEIAVREKAGLAVLPSDTETYVAVSNSLIQMAKEANPETEVYSIDEVFCRYPQADWEDLEEAGRKIMTRVHDELGVTVSVGNGLTKYSAKMCTKHFKPNRMTTCRDFSDYARMFHKMPVDDLHGVGEKTAEKLAALNIHTVESLAESQPWELRPTFKEKWSNFLVAAAWGTARWEFVPWYVQAITPPKSVGNTAGLQFRMRGSLEAAAEALIGAVVITSHRMQVHNYTGNTITVGLRYNTAGSMDNTNQQKLNMHTNSEERIVGAALSMLTKLYDETAERQAINRVGVKVSGIKADMPLQLEFAKT